MRRMFSEKQIKRMVAEAPQEVLEALQNQDLKVKTVEQSEPYKSFDTSFIAPPTGIEMTERYCKVIVVNNILYIIGSFTATNTTESSIAFPSPAFEFEVDDEVGSKIICVNGEKVSDTYTAEAQICSIIVSYDNNFTSSASRKIVKTGKNKIKVYFAGGSIAAAGTEQYHGRQWISLF